MTTESLLYVVVRLAAVLLAWIAAYAVHSTILLGAAWAFVHTRPRASHALRDLLWKTALVSSVVTATVQTAGAVQSLGGRHDVGRVLEARQWRAVPRSVPIRGVTARAMSGAATASGGTAREPSRLGPPTPLAAPERYGARLRGASAGLRLVPLALVLAWGAYAVVVLVRVAFATRRARAALGVRAELADPDVRAAFADVAGRFGLRRPVRLTVSDEQTSPVVLWAPGAAEICLPQRALTDLAPDELRAVLAHEIAHLVRRDPAWLLAAVTLESLFFFQPLNRATRAQLQAEAEFLSDDLAAGRATSGVVLARCLARVAEWCSERPPGAAAEMLAPALTEHRASLGPRVRRLLDAAPSSAAPRATTAPSVLQRAVLTAALPAVVLVTAPGFSPGAVRAWGTPAFRWEGTVPAGRSIEIKGLMGDIRAEPWNGRTVVVGATRHGRATTPDVAFVVVTHDAGVTICAVYPTPRGTPPNECRPGVAGRQFNTPANDVEIEFLVHVPARVGFIARTATGSVTTGSLDAPVRAASASGDIDVTTAAYAGARSASGHVTVRMGRTTWEDTLSVTTRSGNIRVWLPDSANTEIAARSTAGAVRSEFPLAGARRGWIARLKPTGSLGEHASGTLGVGGRRLVLTSGAGTIAIHRVRR